MKIVLAIPGRKHPRKNATPPAPPIAFITTDAIRLDTVDALTPRPIDGWYDLVEIDTDQVEIALDENHILKVLRAEMKL